MTPGAMLLRMRRPFMGGPRTAWYREVVRPRILRAAPLRGTSDASACEVHLLTSAQDWLNACWAIRSFYRMAERQYALCIHDDGTLPASSHQALKCQFPDARIITRTQADDDLKPWLAGYPRCAEFRATNKLALKVFDLLFYSHSPRVVLLDSDILFVSRPDELLRRIEEPSWQSNCANADVATAYTVTPETVRKHCGFGLIERFNSGLCVIQRESLQLSWFEEFLGLPGILSHPWRVEQTLLALASSRFGVELLPDEYSVSLGAGFRNRPCKHYVGAIRDLFYWEGISFLAKGALNGNSPRTWMGAMLSQAATEAKR